MEYGELAINTLDGKLYYKNSSDTLIHSLDEIQSVAAVTSQTLIKGEVVYASGAVSGKIQVSKFSALSTFGVDESKLVGLAANGTGGTANETVNIVSLGKLYDVVYADVKQTGEVDTWVVGTDLYVSATTTGKLTATAPTAPNLRIVIATVVSVNSGNRTLLIRFQPKLHLNEVHDVYAPSPMDGQVIKWTAVNNRWEAGTVSGGSGGNSFTNIAVSGQSAIVADSSSDTLTFANGGGIVFTTDVNTDTLTLAVDTGSFLSTGGGTVNGDLVVGNSAGAFFSVWSGEAGASAQSILISSNQILSEDADFIGNYTGTSRSFIWYGVGSTYALEVNGTTSNVRTQGTFESRGNYIKNATGEGSFEQVITTSTTATTANQVLVMLDSTIYRTVKFLIQVKENTNYEATEILAIHNGTTATHTEYGNIVIGTSPATFNVDISGGLIRLLTTPTSASSTEFKILATSISI